MENDKEKQEKIDSLMKILEINKSGYAGILPNGNIVDRREHPKAYPIQANPMFCIPEPKELPNHLTPPENENRNDAT